MDPKTDYNDEPAHPGKPLEPDELEPSPPEFQTATQSAREQKDVEAGAHPTSELSTLKRGRSAGRPSSGTHPTTGLDIRRKR